MVILFLIVFAFFIGSLPTGYFLGKLEGIDLREHGSGNIGASNARRVLGNRAGLYTLVFDVLKGMLAVSLPTFARYLDLASPAFAFDPVVGLAAIMGHCYSPVMDYKGGKGVATSLGVFMILAPAQTLIAILIFIGVFSFVRIASVSSLSAAATLLALISLGIPMKLDGLVQLVATFTVVIIFVKHWPNIVRLFHKQELKTDPVKSK